MLSSAQTMANKLLSPKNKLRLGGAKRRQAKLDAAEWSEKAQQQKQPKPSGRQQQQVQAQAQAQQIPQLRQQRESQEQSRSPPIQQQEQRRPSQLSQQSQQTQRSQEQQRQSLERQSQRQSLERQQSQESSQPDMAISQPKSRRPSKAVSFNMLEASPPRHAQPTASLVLNAHHATVDAPAGQTKAPYAPRTVMVALDGHVPLRDDSPLHWLLESMALAHDRVICVHRPRRVRRGSFEADEATGEARELLAQVVLLAETLCPDVPLRLTLEYGVGGAAHRMIQGLIKLYEPAMLVMGPAEGDIDEGISSLVNSHGRDSVKHSLQYSPVPVVVVRPEVEREANRHERRNELTYAQILLEACGGVHESAWKDTGGLTLYPEEVIRAREGTSRGGSSSQRRRSDSDEDEDDDSDSDSDEGEFEVVSGAQVLAVMEANGIPARSLRVSERAEEAVTA